MQQRRPEQPFRRDRFPARILVELGKLAIEARQHLVHDLRDEAQRLPRRDARLNVDNENSNPEVLSDPRAGPLALQARTESYSLNAVSQREIQQPAKLALRVDPSVEVVYCGFLPQALLSSSLAKVRVPRARTRTMQFWGIRHPAPRWRSVHQG
jgi:hypothetical protein